MSRRFRLILTIIFAAGFAIIAPAVLFTTAGYRYDWRKNRIQKTGIIQTDSVPESASVILNGIALDQVTPSPLTRLLPENYRIRFEKPGYFPWEKTVEVRSGETTFVTSAALIKDEMPKRLLEIESENPSFSPDGTRLAYFVSGQGRRSLHVIDFSAAADSGNPPKPRLLEEISVKTAANDELRWSDDGLTLFSRASGKTFNVETATAVKTKAPADTAPAGKIIFNGKVYGIRKIADTPWLEQSDLAPGSLPVMIGEMPRGSDRFIEAPGPVLLVADSGRRRIALVSPDDGTIMDTITATDAVWFGKGKNARLLAWNDYEITEAQPFMRTHRTVTRLGRPIKSCAWHPSGFASFYLTDGMLKTIDLDVREPKNVNNLAPGWTVSAFSVDEAAEKIRFIGETNGVAGIFERKI